MLTVHHLETSRSQRVLWLLEELGIEYKLKVYKRHPRTRLAPPELRRVHPLGKSPVITEGDEVVAESGAILEYLAEVHGDRARGELARLQPAVGTAAHRQCRYWMHYAEGSLMNWLLMKLVFVAMPKQRMPFFARPVARAISATVQAQLIDPNLSAASEFIDAHLKQNPWFAGDALTLADFQMSYPIEALLTRGGSEHRIPHVTAYHQRIVVRPAYQRALAKGGPAVLAL
ncbi:MAG TPA: glutathione S-transferase [Burkholderiaceae bacterium]|nr:glutathione S-transferase [Burkholderiaceae bacterium]